MLMYCNVVLLTVIIINYDAIFKVNVTNNFHVTHLYIRAIQHIQNDAKFHLTFPVVVTVWYSLCNHGQVLSLCQGRQNC